jgi:hypothetical protein
MAKRFAKYQNTENEVDGNFRPVVSEVVGLEQGLPAQRILTAFNFKVEE